MTRHCLLAATLLAALTPWAAHAGPTAKLLYSFGGTASDGFNPYGSLVVDKHGNLYGTTYNGGTSGFGTIFQITPAGTETILYTFTGGKDGGDPFAALIIDQKGTLFGTTQAGGKHNFGAIFRLSPPKAGQTAWTEKVLYSFAGGTDGGQPTTPLLQDAAGNLYGTTPTGGAANAGTVYALTPTGAKSTLYAFAGLPDGATPDSGLVMDTQGNLYGTTKAGGTSGLCYYSGCGTLFEIPSTGGESVVYSFGGTPVGGGTDGTLPTGGLLLLSGELWGATQLGGTYDGGTIFALPLAGGGERVIWNFACGISDGCEPNGPLVADANGNLYGTTNSGGTYSQGIVFQLFPTGVETVLSSFGKDGEQPFSGPIFGKNGDLYATTAWGGAYGAGAMARIAP